MKRIVSTNWVRESVEAKNVILSTQYNVSYHKSKVHHSVLRFKDVFKDLGHDYADVEFKGYIVESVRFENGTIYERNGKNTVVSDETSMAIKEIVLINESNTRKVCISFYNINDTMDKIDIISIDIETGLVEQCKTITHNYYCSNEYSIINRYPTPNPLSINDYRNLEFIVRNEKYDGIPKKVLYSIEHIVIQKGLHQAEIGDDRVTTIESDLTLYPEDHNINDVNTYPVNIKTTKTRYEIEDESLYSDEAEYEQVAFDISVLAFADNIRSEYKGIQYTKTKQIIDKETIYKKYSKTNFECRDDDKLLVRYREYKDEEGNTIKVRERNNKKNLINGKPYNITETTYDANGEVIKSLNKQYKGETLISTRMIDTKTYDDPSDSNIIIKKVVESVSKKEDNFKEKEVNKQVRVIYTLPFKEFGLLY